MLKIATSQLFKDFLLLTNSSVSFFLKLVHLICFLCSFDLILFSESTFFFKIRIIFNACRNKRSNPATFAPYLSEQWSILACFRCREQITLGCQLEVVKSPKPTSCEQRRSRLPRRRMKVRSSSSRSRSSGSSRYSGRYSRSSSLSSWRYDPVTDTTRTVRWTVNHLYCSLLFLPSQLLLALSE